MGQYILYSTSKKRKWAELFRSDSYDLTWSVFQSRKSDNSLKSFKITYEEAEYKELIHIDDNICKILDYSVFTYTLKNRYLPWHIISNFQSIKYENHKDSINMFVDLINLLLSDDIDMSIEDWVDCFGQMLEKIRDNHSSKKAPYILGWAIVKSIYPEIVIGIIKNNLKNKLRRIKYEDKNSNALAQKEIIVSVREFNECTLLTKLSQEEEILDYALELKEQYKMHFKIPDII